MNIPDLSNHLFDVKVNDSDMAIFNQSQVINQGTEANLSKTFDSIPDNTVHKKRKTEDQMWQRKIQSCIQLNGSHTSGQERDIGSQGFRS